MPFFSGAEEAESAKTIQTQRVLRCKNRFLRDLCSSAIFAFETGVLCLVGTLARGRARLLLNRPLSSNHRHRSGRTAYAIALMATTLTTQTTGVATHGRPRPALSEDWLAVVLGGTSILLVLAGVRILLPAYGWATASDLSGSVFSLPNLTSMLAAGGAVGILATAGVVLMKEPAAKFIAGFPALYVLASMALVIAGNRSVTAWGFEYVIFAFLFGLAISNSVGVPVWLAAAARSEFYIKTGLVILGASVVFTDLLNGGVLGILQALLVVSVVWYVCFTLARRLRVDDEFATMLATAVSICGVSAAIAACGAIQGDKKKLSYVTSLVLIVAAPMMVIMPHVIRAFGIPDVVGGAWLGGTLDTSASVVAAGEMLSEPARNAGVVVKLSQNVLIGVAAFALTIWWTLRSASGSAGQGRGASARVIWERFPKFVLGFIAVSFAFSFVIDHANVVGTKSVLTGLRTLWFALAFTSIGLETRFSDLFGPGRGRPALAFLGGQGFNVVWTLLLAYLLFGGVLFDVPTFN